MKNNWQKAASILKKGGVIVAPTDTLYGILTKALNKKAVIRVHKIKGRDQNKPFILLISSFDDLKKFGIKLTPSQDKFLHNIWPSKVSVILSCSNNKFRYLHKWTNTIAFRMIRRKNSNLYNLIEKVGPLVAPSANPQGKIPSKNIQEAKKYFKDQVDLYVSGHPKISKPSTLIKLDKKITIIRQGETKVKNNLF